MCTHTARSICSPVLREPHSLFLLNHDASNIVNKAVSSIATHSIISPAFLTNIPTEITVTCNFIYIYSISPHNYKKLGYHFSLLLIHEGVLLHEWRVTETSLPEHFQVFITHAQLLALANKSHLVGRVLSRWQPQKDTTSYPPRPSEESSIQGTADKGLKGTDSLGALRNLSQSLLKLCYFVEWVICITRQKTFVTTDSQSMGVDRWLG